MSEPSSPTEPPKTLGTIDPTESGEPLERPESPASSETSGSSEAGSAGPSEGEPAEADGADEPFTEPSPEVALVWYGGLLREISPIDMTTWDYDTDLEGLTKKAAYTFPVRPHETEFLDEMRARLEAMPIETVLADAEAGDMWMQVELAMRLICGCTIATDCDRAEEMLKAICRQDNDDPQIRHVRAAAERLDAWYDSFQYYSATGLLDALYCAARRCSRALWIETVLPKSKPSLIPTPLCPIDLRVADSTYRHVDAGDFNGRDLDPAKDEKMEKIRLAWLDHTVKRYVFLRYGPKAKICAHGPCESRGTEEKPLFRCEGNCPEQWKPLYCSKECQDKEARHHKTFCTETVLSTMPEKALIRSLYSVAQVTGRTVIYRPTYVDNKIDRDVWMYIAARVL
ncbi:hypothetical protein PENSPDRAFT_740313 [Peniophora sp. CONT]|nr:hypothetical protein PENSPDRAFT_740313 [Peniophora sp. CONT]